MIRGITFSEQTFYSADFAHFQNVFLNRNSGITKGCTLVSGSDKVTINQGYFIVYGRMMNVEEAEIIDSAKFSNGYNRIVYEIDLSKENTITEFKQGYIRVLTTTDLVQQDLDAGGKVYQFPFCSFQWDGTQISNFVGEAPSIVFDNIYSQVLANYNVFKTAFENYFDTQKNALHEWVEEQEETVNGLVADLENSAGRVLGSIFFTDKVLTAADFTPDSTYDGYPYKAEITVDGITADFVSDVNFAPKEAEAGIFATLTKTEAGKITLYASEIPETAITIPTIECRTGHYSTTGSIDLAN